MRSILSPLLLVALLGLTLAAQGCMRSAPAPTAAAPSQATLARCCTDMEDYPRWFVDMARTVAPVLGTVLSHAAWRSGHLKSKQAAQDAVMDVLQPLDIVLVSSKGRGSGRLIPGLFGHAAIYLGTEQDLQRLGISASPEVKPHLARIRSGHVFIEADAKGVHLSPSSIVLNTDAVAILRPHFDSLQQRRRTALDFVATLGMRFDFLFNVDSTDCTFCAELIHRVMPQLDLPITEIYGVRTIMPDSLAVSAIRKQHGLVLVGYVKGDRKGWRQASMADLIRDIGRDWARRQP
ncbi:MAG: YiiX/YebB-like N1pC/P60 family cysteine hydrolase [Hoeflea sp.]|uniref:YiiX/YebB-like N1pC/P60 family cysteine hydrolase n=1 Tax=Hoeflea sp. TaxID=1940281 RepID=UPI0027314C5C|nr:YiiX/YebB-like N1pC/P60 family cysteine hydrolase [Hoeflea sp.]MDP2118814.1 YiiX/YebB-like N1pC/P60 family cysteine hydrolase [Hoeflea sp.]